jgi:magnesium-transporting ATPase (P-type)
MVQLGKSPNIRQPENEQLWNAKTLALVSAAVVIITACTVFLLSKKSIYDELEITVSIIAFVLFAFLAYGLYNGATIVGKPLFPELKFVDPSLVDAAPIDVPDIDVGDGIGGIIISIVLWIVLTIILFILLTFVLTTVWSVLLVLIFALYWLFYRALRIVFLKARICKGDLGLSIQYSLMYTVLYTGWIFGLIWLSKNYLNKG